MLRVPIVAENAEQAEAMEKAYALGWPIETEIIKVPPPADPNGTPGPGTYDLPRMFDKSKNMMLGQGRRDPGDILASIQKYERFNPGKLLRDML